MIQDVGADEWEVVAAVVAVVVVAVVTVAVRVCCCYHRWRCSCHCHWFWRCCFSISFCLGKKCFVFLAAGAVWRVFFIAAAGKARNENFVFTFGINFRLQMFCSPAAISRIQMRLLKNNHCLESTS